MCFLVVLFFFVCVFGFGFCISRQRCSFVCVRVCACLVFVCAFGRVGVCDAVCVCVCFVCFCTLVEHV